MSDDVDALIDQHLAAKPDDVDALIDSHLANSAPLQGVSDADFTPQSEAAQVQRDESVRAQDRQDIGPTLRAILRAGVNGATLGRAPQLLGLMDPEHRAEYAQEYAQASKDHPLANLGGALLTPLPGLGKLKDIKGAAGVAARLGANSALGAGLGVATGGTDMSPTKRALLGAGAGLLGGGVSEGLGALGSRAARKVMDIDETVARKAAADAAAQTASLKSKAGSTAQNAYRQLEHLRDTGALDGLSGEAKVAADKLTAELQRKAAEKLVPAVSEKEASAAAYSDALSSEGARAQDFAAQKLSPGELRQQVGARALRYGLPAVLGGVGSALLGHSPAEGALMGGALGHTFRPMMHSLKRLAAQPVVQRPIAQFTADALRRFAPKAEASIPALVHAAEPASASFVPAFADDDNAPRTSLAQALARISKESAP